MDRERARAAHGPAEHPQRVSGSPQTSTRCCCQAPPTPALPPSLHKSVLNTPYVPGLGMGVRGGEGVCYLTQNCEDIF